VGIVLRHPYLIYTAVFSRDGKLILTAGADGSARIWETFTGKPVGKVMQHDGALLNAVFNADATRVLTSCSDNTARLWDAKTGIQTGVSMNHEGRVDRAVFSPDEKTILTQSNTSEMGNSVARIWNTNTGKAIGAVMRHGTGVETSVDFEAFSPDGKFVITAGTDSTACLWDAKNGSPVGSPLKHFGSVNSAVFSPDGKRILTSSDDGTAMICDIAGDLDIPAALFTLQAKVITGCELNIETNETEMIPFQTWDTLKAQYTQMAIEHYKHCLYRSYNLWCRFNVEDAKKVVTEKNASPAAELKTIKK
jgi:WD40 repeat protein